MNRQLAIISGTSRGIGKSILNAFLKTGTTCLTINRSQQNLSHPILLRNFVFDLEKIDQIDELVNELLQNMDLKLLDKIYLINNAAVIGQIGSLDTIPGPDIKSVLDVNLTAPLLLSSALIREIKSLKVKLEIVHISSGAAFSPISGLGPYCISKAALEMLSKSLNGENRTNGVRSVTIGPGVVDTNMQKELRSSDPLHFAAHGMFTDFKSKGVLQSPDEVGQKMVDFILKGDYEGGRYYGISDL
jgi:NAD(P)-dependent dehydrogenase (short-subunit alcohol dehydrogenase family)